MKAIANAGTKFAGDLSRLIERIQRYRRRRAIYLWAGGRTWWEHIASPELLAFLLGVEVVLTVVLAVLIWS